MTAPNTTDSPSNRDALNRLRDVGSFAAPGFMNPEGIVIFHVASNQSFKITLEGDASPKSLLVNQGT